jgi:sialate O-acetylesterase
MFPLMIQTWRDDWKQGDFPFYWVQLADFLPEQPLPGDSAWAELREAQTMTQDRLPKTGEAVIIDIGEGADIHPRNKLDVARRLARWALDNDYGREFVHQSPRYASMSTDGDTITVKFKDAGGGLRTVDTNTVEGFAIAGDDKKWVWAEAKIVAPDQVAVRSPDVAKPVAVRYAWADNPKCNLYNQAGLPLTPFRTDDWPGVTVNAR